MARIPPEFAAQFPFRKGDRIRVATRASVTTDNKLFARVRYEGGELDRFEVDITHAGDRAGELKYTEKFKHDGFMEALTVDTGIVTRGECYVGVFIDNEGELLHYPLCATYVDVPHLPLGFFEPPCSGRGKLSWVTVASDVAGNTDTALALGVAGALRLVRGIVVYYDASADVANRTVRMRVDRVGGAVPTGFAAGTADDQWNQAAITLSASEQGSLYTTDEFSSSNDATVLSVENNASAPNPFPMWVEPDDNIRLLVVMGSGHANDRYSAYAQIEEWIKP